MDYEPKCLVVGDAGPGEMFPPICALPLGHDGLHQTARITRMVDQTVYRFDQESWEDDGGAVLI